MSRHHEEQRAASRFFERQEHDVETERYLQRVLGLTKAEIASLGTQRALEIAVRKTEETDRRINGMWGILINEVPELRRKYGGR